MGRCTRTAPWRRSLSASLAAITLAALPSCSADAQQDEAGNHPPADGKVIQPGRPGEEAETLAPDATVPATQHNRADVEFVQMMIPHHAQALEMGRLARSRARDPQVRAMAQRIADAQGAEILAMSAWLQRNGLKAPTTEDLEHRAHHGPMMSGMLSPAQMKQLAAARGRRFDVLFLRFMIQHHQGAVNMAGKVLDSGRGILVSEMATDVSAGQKAEIARMRDLLRSR